MNLFQLATRGVDLGNLPDEEAPRQSVAFEPSTNGGKFSVPSDLNDAFEFAAKDFGIDPDVLRAVAYAESRFHPDVVSGKVKSKTGATGLMQFMPATAKEYGIDPLDPVQSIFGAAAYLRKSLDKFDGDYGKAVASYNAGPNRKDFNTDDWDARMPAETQGYLRTVFTAADQLKQVGAAAAQPTLPDTQATKLPAGVKPSTAGGGRGSVSPGDINTKLTRTAVPDMTAGSVAQDIGSGLLQVGPTAVKGVGELVRLATGDRMGKGITDFADQGIKSVQEVVGSDRAAAQRQNLNADMADDSISLSQAIVNNKGALSDQIIPTLGSMAIPLGVAGAAGKVATLGRVAQGMDKAALVARVASVQQAAGIGATAAQNAASTFAELVDKGVSLPDAYTAAGITVPFSVIAGKLTGGGAEGALIKGFSGKAVARGAAETGKATLREGFQEGGESLGQVAGEVLGANQDVSLQSGIKRVGTEALLGAVVGGGTHAMQMAAPRVEEQPTTPTIPTAAPNSGVIPGNSNANTAVIPGSDSATQAVDNIAALLKQTEANIDGTATQATPVQPGSQAADSGAAAVDAAQQGATEGQTGTGTAVATGQSESAQSLTQPDNFSATPTATVGTQTNVQAGTGFTATGIAADMAALKARSQPQQATQQAQPVQQQQAKPRTKPQPLLNDTEAAMLSDFERMYQADVKGEIKTRLGLMPARQDEATAPAEKRKPSELLAAIKRAGGIKSTNAGDLMGGSAMDANRILPGLFTKGGMNLDLLVPFLKERGYLTQADEDGIKDNGGVNKLAEILQAELSGDRAQTVDSTAGYEDVSNKSLRSDLDNKAFALGLPMKVTNEMSDERLNGVINRIERKLGRPVNTDFATRKMSRTEAMAERQAILMADRVERARAQYDADIQAFAESDDNVQDAALDVFTDENGDVVIVNERDADAELAARTLNGSWSDQNGQETATTQDSRTGTDTREDRTPVARGSDQGTQADQGNGTEAGAGEEGLTSYTPAEVTARQDAAKESEATAKRAEDAAARAEAAAKQASEIAQRSVAAADTFELGGNAEDNLSGQQGLGFSKTDQSPSTPASTIREAITKAYGNLLTRLEGKGLVSLTQTEEDAIAAAAQARADKNGGDVEAIKESLRNSVAGDELDVKRSSEGNLEGFFDPATGKSYLIADNLTAESAPGTLMHEVGIHMAADGKLEPLFTRAGNLLKLARNNPFIQLVRARMDQAGETSNEEAAAYIVTEYENDRVAAPDSVVKWVKDFIADVRAWLFNKGVLLKADQLTVADIAAVARANARGMAKGDAATDGTADIRRSMAGGGQQNTSQAKAAVTRSLWKDESGRMQFAPGAWLFEKMGNAASPFLSWSGMKAASPELKKQLREMKLGVQKAQETSAMIATEASKLSQDEREMVSDLIEKTLKAGVVPPAHAVKLAALINETMSKQTDELIELGMLSAETAERWRGEYLPRFYADKLRKNTDPWADALKNITKRARMMMGVKGKHLKARGLFETVAADQVADYEALGWEVRDPDFDPATDETAQMWRDFTPEERENMGEIRDAGFRFVMGYMQTQKDIALGRMFKRMAEADSMSSRLPTGEFTVRVPDTKVEGTGANVYGALAGRYVSKDTLDHLSGFGEVHNDMLATYRKAMSLWKEGKTVLNPVSHVNNTISNVTMAHLAGVGYHRVDKYAAAVRDFAKGSKMIQEAKDAGLFLGGFNEAELFDSMPDELKNLAKIQEGTGTKVVNGLMQALTFGQRKRMAKAYEFEDSFFKYLIYRDARSRGMDAGDAVDYAQKYIFTYDDLPKTARKIRDFGMPFFAYTYKAVPALLETAMTHPVRMALPAAMIWAGTTLAYALAEAGDDEPWDELAKRYANDSAFRDAINKRKEYDQEHLPKYMQGYTALAVPKSIRVGMDETLDMPVFMDISRLIPSGDAFDVTPNAGGLPLPQPLTPNHPILTLFTGLIANKDTFKGNDLVDKNDTSAEAAWKRMVWVYRQVAPAIAAGNYHWDRGMEMLANAAGGEIKWLPEALSERYTGIGKDGLPITPEYGIPQTFGIKIRPMDQDKAEAIEQAMDNKLLREIDAEIRQIKRLNNLGAMSDKLADKKIDYQLEKKDRIREGLTVDGDAKR